MQIIDPSGLRKIPDGWEKATVYSDTHGFTIRPDAEKFVHEEIKLFKPDHIYHLGDGIQGDFASKWPDGHEHSDDARVDGQAFLDHMIRTWEIRKNKATYDFMMGNHDDNPQRAGRLPHSVRSMFDFSKWELIAPIWKKWKLHSDYEYSEKGMLRPHSQITFMHGYEAGLTGDGRQACRRGRPYGLTVAGHTHRVLPVKQLLYGNAVALPYWYANPGTLGPLKPEYTRRVNTDGWGAACVHIVWNPKHRDPYSYGWFAQVIRMDEG
jgi:predicted phosphodiesterase